MKIKHPFISSFYSVFLLSLLFFCKATSAACPTNIYGSSKQFGVVISQDCGMESTIVISKIDKKTGDHTVPYQTASFNSECKFIYHEKKLSCHKKGKTILSGVEYKLTYDDKPHCPDEKFEYRYTCIKGCTKQIPRYLSVDPYEC